MKRLMVAAVTMLGLGCTQAADELEPVNVYQPLSWSQVESQLPTPEGSRPMARQQMNQVLGTGFCLEGVGARTRLQSALLAAKWQVMSAEPLGDSRLDVTAERGALVLTGSLTTNPSEGCEQGFVYTVRKAEVTP